MDIKDIEGLVKEDLEREQENRKNAQDDIKFAKMAEQWPDDIKDKRDREGRPCLTINRMPTFIRQVVNDSRINSPQIKVKPVDDNSDPETAEVFSGLIRNIEYVSQADVAYDTGLDSAATCGMGFWKVDTDYVDEQSFAQEIFIRRVTNPLSVIYDSHSESIDGSDWMHCAITEWITADEYKKRYKKEPIRSFCSEHIEYFPSSGSDELVLVADFWKVDETPSKLLMLSDGNILTEDEYLKEHPDFGIPLKDILSEMGVYVARERLSNKRKVKKYTCGSDILEESDWAGKFIPIIPVFGDEVFSDGKRYLKSMIRDAKDPQRMYNFWRTATAELIALAPRTPFIGPAGAFDTDSEKWETANTASHPFIQYDGAIPPQRQPYVGVPIGHMQEALSASDDMKTIIGMQDASLGIAGNETSGRAIVARQREGDVSTFHFIDNHAKSIAHTGRILVDLIPKIYDTERIVRIIGVDGTTKNVPLKQTTQWQGIQKIFDLGVGRYDVAVDTGPSFSTQREEAATQMMELIRTFPQAAPIIGDLVAKNLNWPGADDIAKRLKAMLPPQIQNLEEQELPPEAMAKVSALESQLGQLNQAMQQGMGEFQKVVSELEAMKADKSIELRKLDIDAYAKETDRIKVQAEIGNMVANNIAKQQPLYQDQQPIQQQF